MLSNVKQTLFFPIKAPYFGKERWEMMNRVNLSVLTFSDLMWDVFAQQWERKTQLCSWIIKGFNWEYTVLAPAPNRDSLYNLPLLLGAWEGRARNKPGQHGKVVQVCFLFYIFYCSADLSGFMSFCPWATFCSKIKASAMEQICLCS